MTRTNESETPMRSPFASSSASGKRSFCDHSRKAVDWVSRVASAPGRERWIRSPQASSRSLAADSLRCRSWSMCCSTRKPEAKANSSITATTVA
jgi:hypothetical protein